VTAVTLPTAVAQAEAQVRYLDWGGDLEPSLGGPVQHIDRLGSRHAVDFTLPPIGSATAAMQWCQRLKRAKSLGAVMKFPQVGFTMGSSGSPTISGAHSATATAINLSGLSGGYTEGQYISIIHAGRRYLYSFDNTGSSLTSVAISPMLRTALSNGDTVELVAMIEGRLVGNEVGWNVSRARTYGLAFTIEEVE
jgi:hypothetical protein